MIRQDGRSDAPLTASARLKPSALRILGALQQSPQTNVRLQTLGGFRYGARVAELRLAGHVIACDALGPTKGARTYTLYSSAQEAGGNGGGSGKPLPAPDALFAVIQLDMRSLDR